MLSTPLLLLAPDGGRAWAETKSIAPQERLVGGRVVRENIVTLEASIWYYATLQALANVKAALPCTRLVWLLRNPLPRARSLYYHELTRRPYRLTGR